MAKNDDTIKALMTKVEAQKAKLGDRPRASWKTTGLFKYADGTTFNLATIKDPETLVDALSFLIGKVLNRSEASKALGVKEPVFFWNGYTVADYEEDFKTRLSILSWEYKKRELDATEAKLKTLVSEEARTEMELADIAKLLQ